MGTKKDPFLSSSAWHLYHGRSRDKHLCNVIPLDKFVGVTLNIISASDLEG